MSLTGHRRYLRWVFLQPRFHMIATIAAVAEKMVSVIVVIDMIAVIATIAGE